MYSPRRLMARPLRPGLSRQRCPIAAALAIVGERCTLLVLRDVFHGVVRFDDVVRDSGLARKTVADRLRRLVAAGLLERRWYREFGERPQYAYCLTAMGRDLLPVMLALAQWGERYVADDAIVSIRGEHRTCGATVEVALRCADNHPVEPSAATARLRPT